MQKASQSNLERNKQTTQKTTNGKMEKSVLSKKNKKVVINIKTNMLYVTVVKGRQVKGEFFYFKVYPSTIYEEKNIWICMFMLKMWMNKFFVANQIIMT